MGYRVKEVRKEKGMTQVELARRSGVSRQTIGKIEKDDGYITNVGVLMNLAKALDTTIDSIFFQKAV